jgi:hypothetical protein
MSPCTPSTIIKTIFFNATEDQVHHRPPWYGVTMLAPGDMGFVSCIVESLAPGAQPRKQASPWSEMLSVPAPASCPPRLPQTHHLLTCPQLPGLPSVCFLSAPLQNRGLSGPERMSCTWARWRKAWPWGAWQWLPVHTPGGCPGWHLSHATLGPACGSVSPTTSFPCCPGSTYWLLPGRAQSARDNRPWTQTCPQALRGHENKVWGAAAWKGPAAHFWGSGCFLNMRLKVNAV